MFILQQIKKKTVQPANQQSLMIYNALQSAYKFWNNVAQNITVIQQLLSFIFEIYYIILEFYTRAYTHNYNLFSLNKFIYELLRRKLSNCISLTDVCGDTWKMQICSLSHGSLDLFSFRYKLQYMEYQMKLTLSCIM